MNDMYQVPISCVYVNMQLKKSGGGGGSGLDYVILLSERGLGLDCGGPEGRLKLIT